MPLLPGMRVLVRNFRRHAAGKLAPRWVPRPHIVLSQLRPDEPVYLMRPEGQSGPGRTLHRNNIRSCPAGVPSYEEVLLEEVQQGGESPRAQHLPFLPQRGFQPIQRGGQPPVPLGDLSNYSPGVAVAPSREGPGPSQGEEEQTLLEVLPAEVEGVLDTGALPDDEGEETDGQGVANSPEHTRLRQSLRCNRGKPLI